MQKHKVSHLVRVCDASYDVTRVAKEGIEVKDWPFVDGDAPPDSIITQWLDLVSRMSESKGVSDLFRFFIQSCSCCASTRRLASVMPHSGNWHSYSLRRRSRPRSGISWHRTCWGDVCSYRWFFFFLSPHLFMYSERNGCPKCHNYYSGETKKRLQHEATRLFEIIPAEKERQMCSDVSVSAPHSRHSPLQMQ